QASPTPSPSLSGCLPPSSGRTGLKVAGQLSCASGMPSPSLSVALMLPSYTVEPLTAVARWGVQVGSLSGAPQKKAGYDLALAVVSAASVLPVSLIAHTDFIVPHTSSVSQPAAEAGSAPRSAASP